VDAADAAGNDNIPSRVRPSVVLYTVISGSPLCTNNTTTTMIRHNDDNNVSHLTFHLKSCFAARQFATDNHTIAIWFQFLPLLLLAAAAAATATTTTNNNNNSGFI